MNTELYVRPVRQASAWRRFEPGPKTSTDVGHFTMLYVGKNEEFPHLFEGVFNNGILAENLTEAQNFFKQISRSQYPDAIIIDVPFEKNTIQYFQDFLSERKICSRVIVLYNDYKLTVTNINYLKKNAIIDDTINLSTSQENLNRKIRFLKKVKLNIQRPNYGSMDEQIWAKPNRSMILKRFIDIGFSSAILFCCLPVLLLIALLIKLDSPGPVIYNSLRAGRGFKIFKFYKFRTMVVGADKRIGEFDHLNQYKGPNLGDARFVKIENDPRVTKFGKFLRNSSLDELPQLINVLKGDMSLVGNRPLPLYEASTLTTNEHVERFMAPAGITGLWQITKRGRTDMSVEERVNLDISYARHNNVIYDLWIVANTPTALFQKSNV
jgi:lipopolysaccharide/colanic/teichoic acid biosynthesis glycosyltransferase